MLFKGKIMKKILILMLIIGCFCLRYDFAQAKEQNDQQSNQITLNQDVQQLNNFMQNFVKTSNMHNFEEIQNYYSPNFISGDGLRKNDVTALIKDSWHNYPDMKYSSEIKDIKVNNDRATIESYDSATGNSVQKSEIANDTATISSNSHSILYLQKFGKDWKLVSDNVYYEKTLIKYGSAKKLDIIFNSPQQVYSGEKYTASLYSDIPNGMFAFGSITRQPIVYPGEKSKEIFRQIPGDTGILERVMQANATNNNELAVASVGYTELGEDANANPDVKFTGMAILLQRINVIPKSTYVSKVTKPESTEIELEETVTSQQPNTENDDKDK